MAQVTYNLSLTIPTAITIQTWAYNLTCSTGFNGAGATSFEDAIIQLKATIEGNFGGTLTYTITTEGSNSIGDLSWTGDLEVGACFALSFYVLDNASETYAAAFYIPETVTTTTTCPTCQEINRSACEDSYTFVAGLTPSTVYYVVIENNRNKRYVQQVTTDGSGDFSIDAAAPEFPIGFFIPEQFKYTIKVYSDSMLINQQDLTVGSTIYTCITLGFINTVTTTASANFGVDFLIDDELNYIVDDLGNTFSV